MIHTRSICAYTVVLLSLWGCSGGDGNPAPLSEDGVTTPFHQAADAAAATAEDAGTPVTVEPTEEACVDEWATSPCTAPVGARAGFVLCAPGVRICSRGHWTTCVTHATSGPVSGWEPAGVGCNAAPEPCARNGEERACVKQLPPTPEAANCYHGTQTCSANAWGACVP